ncbi:hypothetical protein [Hymenobacter sp. AT01-02]|uniref:hypothetical protein n=1 Tax=Hymenobacter sp. AT01-02 TaxID=1571877 RepID=UPI0006E2691F|nr:hypothetical protein [Hymenobacter sp. AT01-02]
MKHIFWLLLVCTLATTSCNRTPKVIDPASAAAVKVQVDILRDTVQARWTEMVSSDDAKLQDLRHVLTALEGQPGTNRAQLRDLQRANSRLKTLRYDQTTMRSRPGLMPTIPPRTP